MSVSDGRGTKMAGKMWGNRQEAKGGGGCGKTRWEEEMNQRKDALKVSTVLKQKLKFKDSPDAVVLSSQMTGQLTDASVILLP